MGFGPSAVVLPSVLLFFFLLHPSSALPLPPFLGIAPHDRKYFESEVVSCRDGSKSFPRQRLNDGFCDCPDGTDEPGTSACPEGRFYCRNSGDVPRSLFSSRVNDRICDCCDGSDEYDGGVDCPNTCRKNGGLADEVEERGFENVFKIHDHRAERIRRVDLEDLVTNIKELRIAAFVEILVAVTLISCCLFHCRAKRRRYSFRNL